MNFNNISLAVVILGGLFFFLKDLYARFKDVESKFNAHDTRINLIELKVSNEFENLEKMMDLKFKILTDKIEELQSVVKHQDNTIKSTADLFRILIDKIDKNEKNLQKNNF